MVHKYFLNGLRIALDVNSGAVHIVDETAFDILDYYLGAADSGDISLPFLVDAFEDKHRAEEVAEAFEEIRRLEEKGLLFSRDAFSSLAGIDRKPVLKALCLLVAQDCNMKCAYCFAGEGEYNSPGSRRLMSFDTAKKAVDMLVEASGARKNLEIDFFGGEPLINFDVVRRTVEYARSLEAKHGKLFRFTVTTNGALLNDEIISYINENMYNAVLSLDGRKAVNDKMRVNAGGQGTYDDIVPKISRLVSTRGDKSYYVRGTFTRHNLDFADDALHMADLGFKHVSLEPVVSPDSADYALRTEDLSGLSDEYEKLALAVIERNKQGKPFNFFHFMVDLEGGPCAQKRVSGCGAGSEYAAVCADGTLYPCHQFASLPDAEKFVMGTVDTGITNLEMANKFSNCGIYSKKGCEDCFAKFYCGGGCAANSYAAGGDINAGYELGCALQRKRTECALMIKCAEAVDGGH